MPSPVAILSGLGAPRLGAIAYGQAVRGDRQAFAAPQCLLGFGDVRAAAHRVGEYVQKVKAKTGARKVSLVGMSLGGLVGLYYLRCRGGAPHVDLFVSVGGPLNGSAPARALDAAPVEWAHALAQTAPDSDFMRELHAAPNPPGVRLVSVGTRGDFVTPRASWEVEGMESIETPYGLFPFGHWLLFTHPGNQRVVAELLAA